MTYLLDVNVLIALIDTFHIAHEEAQRWFQTSGAASFATCPITENDVIRILSNPRYPNRQGSPAEVAKAVGKFHTLPGHHFWSDDVSLVGAHHVDPENISTPAQVTDTYLLALAKAHGRQLATFDRKLSPAAVKGGKSALHLIAGG
ncbi:TA system VapC family ribonuclease toxin [Tianweitania sp.]|uniref:TA system VapC family ribonuclease toxin n=1 Tax=Tianweitania sp. TaxID=2021634 RepID=UPI0028A03410|nr:TA system VapC family ribonuclease toxin [Tianweitania sp.]